MNKNSKLNVTKMSLTTENNLKDLFNEFKKETNSNLELDVSYNPVTIKPNERFKAYIVNLFSYYPNAKPDNGHWIAVITFNKKAIIYTCFGLWVQNLIEELKHQGFDEIIVDLLADQPIKSKSCGFYCLKYILTNKWERMRNYILIRRVGNKYTMNFVDKNELNKTLIRRNNEIFYNMINIEDNPNDNI